MPTVTAPPNEKVVAYQGKAAMIEYARLYKGCAGGQKGTIEQCPNCHAIACFFPSYNKPGYAGTWVDTVSDLAYDNNPPLALASCHRSSDGTWTRRDFVTANYVIQTWHGEVETKTEEKGLCTCDYDTVVRTIGCQCGGR